VGTPCGTCEKFNLLQPDPLSFVHHRGLMPANELAVQLYELASEDVRVGTMDGAYLLRTLRVGDVVKLLDEYDDYFCDDLARRETLEKVLLIDRVFTDTRSEAEEARRESARRQSTRGRGGGGGATRG